MKGGEKGVTLKNYTYGREGKKKNNEMEDCTMNNRTSRERRRG